MNRIPSSTDRKRKTSKRSQNGRSRKREVGGGGRKKKQFRSKAEIVIISRTFESISPMLEKRYGYVNYWSDISRTMGDKSQHVEIFFPDRNSSFTSYINGGVTRKKMDIKRLGNTYYAYWTTYHIFLTVKEVSNIFNFCKSRVGRNYNNNGIFTGALAPKLIRSCDKSESYTCSSLVIKALIRSKTVDRCIKSVSKEYNRWGNQSYFNDIRPDKLIQILSDLTRKYNRSKHPDGKKKKFDSKNKECMKIHFHMKDKRKRVKEYQKNKISESEENILSKLNRFNDFNDNSISYSSDEYD